MSIRDIHTTTNALRDTLEALKPYKAIRTLPAPASQLIKDLENDLETLAKQVRVISGIDFNQADADREQVTELSEELEYIETEQQDEQHDRWLTWARA